MSTDAKTARAVRARIRNRHDNAAAAGIHLPSVAELITGMSWYRRDMCADAQAFAERTMSRLDDKYANQATLRDALAPLTVSPKMGDFELAADVALLILDASACGNEKWRAMDIESLSQRLDFYAACVGNSDACVRVAINAAEMAARERSGGEQSADLAEAALGWASVLTEATSLARYNRQLPIPRTDMRGQARQNGDMLVMDIIQRERDSVSDIAVAKADSLATPVTRVVGKRKFRDTMAAMVNTVATWDPDIDMREDQPPDDGPPGIVVVSAIGSPDTNEGKVVRKIYEGILGKSLPFALAQDTGVVREILARDFPHAIGVIDALLRDVEDGKPIRMRPTVLVGEPGCGKTSLARRMLGLLGVPAEVYPASSSSDNSLGGTARRWSSGESSLPLSLVRRHKIPNPGIILDELEKAAHGGSGGSLRDALLGLLEPSSAKCWHDPLVQAGVDLSAVVYLCTANQVDGIPSVLRDRLRIIRFPSPTSEHLPFLATALLRQAIADRGLVNAWAEELAQFELDGLAEHWPGGSIRKLQRLVEGVLLAREQAYSRA